MSPALPELLVSIRKEFERLARLVKAPDGDFDTDAVSRRQHTLTILARVHGDVWRAYQSRSVLEPDIQLGIEKARRLTVQASGLSSREFSPTINQDAENHFVEGHIQASDDDKARLRKCFRLRVAEDEKQRVLDQFVDLIDPTEIECIILQLGGDLATMGWGSTRGSHNLFVADTPDAERFLDVQSGVPNPEAIAKMASNGDKPPVVISANDERDRFIFQRKNERATFGVIASEIKARTEWEPLESIKGVQEAPTAFL